MKWINNDFQSIKELIESRKLNETYSEITNLDKAAEIISANSKPIVIVGDYDVDGVMSSTIMYKALKRLGHKVRVRIPKRIAEGYGLSPKIIDECEEDDALIITVDNGIAAVDAIAKAKDRGYTVIVTDHHQPQAVLPNADLIVDPHLTKDEFPDFCGAGIALMLAEKLLKEAAEDLYPYAFCATIADVVSLTGDNRRICRKGRSMKVPKALEVLMEKMAVDPLHYSEEDLKFAINPAINAASRILDDAEIPFKLFTTDSEEEMEKLAEQMIVANANRKEAESKARERAEEYISKECLWGDCPLIINIPDCGLGTVGLVAGKLAEKYNVPTIVVTNNNGILKGSCRVPNTIDNYNIKEELEKASDVLLSFGGHKMAAGLSLQEENLQILREKMQKYIQIPEKVHYYDVTITADEVPQTIEEIEKYGPYGPDNDIPIVRVEGIRICPRYGKTHKLMGETIPTVKIFGNGISLIYFGVDVEKFDLINVSKLSVYGQLSFNWFMGGCEPQIILMDEPETIKIKKTTLAERLKARAKGVKA